MKEHNLTNQVTKVKSQELSTQPPKWLTNLAVYTKSDYERSIVNAQVDKTISYFKTKEDYSRLIQIVTKWRIMIGLSKEMSEEELKINVQFIKNSYSALTLKEIDLAMNLSLQGKLEIDVEPYGNFSPLYISRILNAYIKKCEEKINELLIRKRQAEMEFKSNYLEHKTYEEQVESVKKCILFYAESVRKNDKYMGDFNHTVWNFLNNQNLIDPTDEILMEAKQFADLEVKRDDEINGMQKFLKTMRNANFDRNLKKQKEMYGRFFVMRNFFRSLKDVNDFLNQYDSKQILPETTK